MIQSYPFRYKKTILAGPEGICLTTGRWCLMSYAELVLFLIALLCRSKN